MWSCIRSFMVSVKSKLKDLQGPKVVLVKSKLKELEGHKVLPVKSKTKGGTKSQSCISKIKTLS